MITRKTVAQYLSDYLNHRITLMQLVDWAENAMIDSEMEIGQEKVIMEALGRIGVADVKNFGLLWEDCESIVEKLGFIAKVNFEKAA